MRATIAWALLLLSGCVAEGRSAALASAPDVETALDVRVAHKTGKQRGEREDDGSDAGIGAPMDATLDVGNPADAEEGVVDASWIDSGVDASWDGGSDGSAADAHPAAPSSADASVLDGSTEEDDALEGPEYDVGRFAIVAGASMAMSAEQRWRVEGSLGLAYRVDRSFELAIRGGVGVVAYPRVVPDATADRDHFREIVYGAVDLALTYRWGSDALQFGMFLQPGYVGAQDFSALRIAVGMDFRVLVPAAPILFDTNLRPFIELWFPMTPQDEVSAMFGASLGIGAGVGEIFPDGPDDQSVAAAERTIRSAILNDLPLVRVAEQRLRWTPEWAELPDAITGDRLAAGACRAWFAVGPTSHDIDMRGWIDVTREGSLRTLGWDEAVHRMQDDAADEMPVTVLCNPSSEAAVVHLQGLAYESTDSLAVFAVRFEDFTAPRPQRVSAEVSGCPDVDGDALGADVCCVAHIRDSNARLEIPLATTVESVRARAIAIASVRARRGTGAREELRWSDWKTLAPASEGASPAFVDVRTDTIGSPVLICTQGRPDAGAPSIDAGPPSGDAAAHD